MPPDRVVHAPRGSLDAGNAGKRVLHADPERSQGVAKVDMQFSGVQEIAACRTEVWNRLNDPATIRQCIAGCERYEEVGPDKYEAVISTPIGLIWATFKGSIAVFARVPNKGYRIEGTGHGAMAGFGKLAASVRLADSQWGTRLNYSAEAQFDDRLAQLGSYLIQAAAIEYAQAFFARFDALVSSSDT